MQPTQTSIRVLYLTINFWLDCFISSSKRPDSDMHPYSSSLKIRRLPCIRQLQIPVCQTPISYVYISDQLLTSGSNTFAQYFYGSFSSSITLHTLMNVIPLILLINHFSTSCYFCSSPYPQNVKKSDCCSIKSTNRNQHGPYGHVCKALDSIAETSGFCRKAVEIYSTLKRNLIRLSYCTKNNGSFSEQINTTKELRV